MKQFKFYALCLAGLMFLASACEKPVPEPEAELTASAESLSLPAQGAASSIKVTSNQKWTASSDADWLRLSPESGENDGEIAVEATDNAPLQVSVQIPAALSSQFSQRKFQSESMLFRQRRM